jgi:hypothetical protein
MAVMDKKLGGVFACESTPCLLGPLFCVGVRLPRLFLWPAENRAHVCASTVVYVVACGALARYSSQDGVEALVLLWKQQGRPSFEVA